MVKEDVLVGNHAGKFLLNEMWDRMDLICQKLWQEDRSTAVSLQALVEEFRGEVDRSQKTLEAQQLALAEMRHTLQREFEGEYRDRVNKLEHEVANLSKHAATLEEELVRARRRVQELTKDVEARETELIEFKDAYLKSEAEKDTVRAQRMQTFFHELQQKAELLEKTWEQRHASLEQEYAKQAEDLRKGYEERLESLRQRASEMEQAFGKREEELDQAHERRRLELEGREAKCHKWEELLHEKEEAVAKHAHDLESSYQQKRAELDQLKEKMQKEIVSVVRDYQQRK